MVSADLGERFENEAIPFMRQMYPAALRLTGDRCDAEDLLQDTFARAYLKFDLFRADTNLGGWLHRIMVNTFYSTCRRRSRRPEVLAEDVNDVVASKLSLPAARSAEAEAMDNMASSGVMQALEQLPASFKTAVYLADVQGYQYNEIADIMETPLGTVMSRIHRGRQMLRAKLPDRYARTRAEAPATEMAQVLHVARPAVPEQNAEELTSRAA